MQFEFDGEWCRVVRVTGPAHNYLALIVDRRPSHLPLEVEIIRPDGTRARATPPFLDDVVVEIRRGVEHANADLGTRYWAKRMRIVEGDTYEPGIYQTLADQLIRRLAGRQMPRKLAAG